jgi:hypothetical protein
MAFIHIENSTLARAFTKPWQPAHGDQYFSDQYYFPASPGPVSGSPRAYSSATIGPKKEFSMAGESTPQAGNKGGWHSGRFAHRLAAIDLGTNNCRLLVARAAVEGYEVIDAYSRPVRLGEGVALNGTLCGDAIERTVQALSICAAKIERGRVTRARHIATEACRRGWKPRSWFSDIS